VKRGVEERVEESEWRGVTRTFRPLLRYGCGAQDKNGKETWRLALDGVMAVARMQDDAARGAGTGELAHYCSAAHGDALCKLAQALRAAHGLLTDNPPHSYEAHVALRTLRMALEIETVSPSRAVEWKMQLESEEAIQAKLDARAAAIKARKQEKEEAEEEARLEAEEAAREAAEAARAADEAALPSWYRQLREEGKLDFRVSPPPAPKAYKMTVDELDFRKGTTAEVELEVQKFRSDCVMWYLEFTGVGLAGAWEKSKRPFIEVAREQYQLHHFETTMAKVDEKIDKVRDEIAGAQAMRNKSKEESLTRLLQIKMAERAVKEAECRARLGMAEPVEVVEEEAPVAIETEVRDEFSRGRRGEAAAREVAARVENQMGQSRRR